MSHPKPNVCRLLFLFLTCCLAVILSGCASSTVSRDASANVDNGIYHLQSSIDGASPDIADTYQNSTQMAKGAVIGGVAGAAIGGTTTAIGVIPGTAVGAVLGASYGSYIDGHASLADQIRNRGGMVIILGDQVLIIIPSSKLFVAESLRLKPAAYSTLNVVAQFISQYQKMLVKVSAYTNRVNSAEVDQSLSQGQADSIVRYLTKRGVDVRVLYGAGYGGTHLVTRNELGFGEGMNYRIEITLEKLPL